MFMPNPEVMGNIFDRGAIGAYNGLGRLSGMSRRSKLLMGGGAAAIGAGAIYRSSARSGLQGRSSGGNTYPGTY